MSTVTIEITDHNFEGNAGGDRVSFGKTTNVFDKHPKIATRLNDALQKANKDGRTRP
ncbi:MAG: hypothetical protein ACSHYB_03285 [Roseibacillus sp.]